MRRPKTKSPAPARASAPVLAGLRFRVWLMAALLVLVAMVLYWPAMRCDFVNFDDPLYVTENFHVQGGLSWAGVKWAFASTEQAAYWAPVMWLSHMLACQLFGLNPWGHHLINVLLHAVNTALVFLLFRRMTGAFWRSVMVAALFGLHPLRVESVAWVTERKDVLSTCLGLLALWAYACYAQKRSKARGQELSAGSRRLALDYSLALLFFVLGLMSKAMLVTWPFVMLLLDYWPLERFKSNRAWWLVVEKIPFFTLAAAMSVVTFITQQHGGAVAPIANLPWDMRVGNALISYCRYLGKLFWPADLAVFYPRHGYWPMEQVLLAAGLLLGITVLFIVKRGRYPFLLMGWLWFVGTLVPVIQLVQSGEQSIADRFTYVPSLGALILTIWGAYELTRRWRHQVMVLSVAGCAAIILCLGMTRQQLGYWKDGETLFRHSLEVTENNSLAHFNLGAALVDKDQIGEAISEFQEALRLRPDDAEVYYNLGVALGKEGQTDEAIGQYREAIRLKPDFAKAENNLGDALLTKGQTDEATARLQEALRLKPDFAEAHNNLGKAFGIKGQFVEATSQFQEALRLKPDFAEAHYNLGTALLAQGQFDKAISQFQEAIRLKPDYAKAYNNLGNALSMTGQIVEAISQFQEALRLKPDFAEARSNLAHALEIKNAPASR